MSPTREVRRFRVWIARYEDWQPSDYLQTPPEATVLEPAEPCAMSRRQARRYVETFNKAALAGGRKLWAIAVPIGSRCEGEPRPGERWGGVGSG